MPRIILQYPILRHYAGSVFDLEIGNSNLDDDERSRDRMPSKKIYHMPDGGKGYPIEISSADTALCPPSVFEGVDLTTGPCRITSVQTKSNNKDIGEAAGWQLTMDSATLSEDKQGIHILLMPFSPPPQLVQILERKEQQIIKEFKVDSHSSVLDFSSYAAGFYEIKIYCQQDIIHIFTCLKCFPLVVTMDIRTGHFITMKTIW